MEKYKTPRLEVILLQEGDIVCTSGLTGEGYGDGDETTGPWGN